MFKKVILGLLAAFVMFSASAQTAVTEYRATQQVYTGIMSNWHRDKASAAAELMGLLETHLATLTIQCVSGTRPGSRKFNAHITSTDASNPTQWRRNSQTTSMTCVNNTITLEGPYAIGYNTRQVTLPTCTAGDKVTHNYFIAWNSAPGGDLDTNVPGSATTAPSSICENNCTYKVSDVPYCGTETSSSANGYYKSSCDFEFTSTGVNCATNTTPPDPNQPPPLPPETPNPNPDTSDPTGSDPAGSGDCTAEQTAAGTCAGAGDEDGDGVTGGAGDTPTTDPNVCSSAQIAAGTCAGSSGGSGASITDPGTGDDPTTCGGPGQPLCRVQVNETGTPNGQVQRDQITKHGDQITDLAKEDGTFWTKAKQYLQKPASELVDLNWTFQLPTGCAPYQLSGFAMVIDVCQFQGTIHDLMSFLWVLATVAGLMRLFMWGID